MTRNDYTPGPRDPLDWATVLGVTRSRRTAQRWARTATDERRTAIIVPTPDGWFTVWAQRRAPGCI